MQALGLADAKYRVSDSLAEALAISEYGYYFVTLYTVIGGPLGLVLMGDIGSGFLLVLVLVFCGVALGPAVLTVFRVLWLPIACGVSHLFIQLALHGESIYRSYVYQFGPWLISLLIVQALAIYRQGFLRRFAWFTVFMGIAMLPFMSFEQNAAYGRVGLERGVGYANPNAIAGWFGFCTLYFSISGYIDRRPAYRIAAWLIGLVSLYLVTLTVSRGALVALAGALLVASRRLVKVGFLPILLLIGLFFGVLELGYFDQAIRAYGHRGVEETGRFKIWPLLIEMFLDAPIIGVGVSNTSVITSDGISRTPHNSFLLIGVASGAIPLLLFCSYFIQSAIAGLRSKMAQEQDAVFHLPLVVYTFLIVCAGNMDFMAPWAVVSLAVPFVSEVKNRI
jgi:hypothetical protein